LARPTTHAASSAPAASKRHTHSLHAYIHDGRHTHTHTGVGVGTHTSPTVVETHARACTPKGYSDTQTDGCPHSTGHVDALKKLPIP
jgi:hypothetical protein